MFFKPSDADLVDDVEGETDLPEDIAQEARRLLDGSKIPVWCAAISSAAYMSR